MDRAVPLNAKRLTLGVALAFFLYVVSHGVNSSLGGYCGKALWCGVVEWQPHWGSLQYKPDSLVTRLYRPLMELDRAFWHRPIELDDAGWDRMQQLKRAGKLVLRQER